MNRAQISTLVSIFAIQVLGLLYYSWFLSQYGYLPSPFLQQKSDTFMDLFYTLYWSENDGRYTVWKSVYPPLNFILLKVIKLVFLGKEQFSDALELRESAFPVVIFFLFSYLITPIVILKTKLWNRFTAAKKTLLYFIIILSTPMLFALERGNLIIYTLIIIALVLNSEGLLRACCIAVLINLKPYLALLLFFYLARRNWKELLLCTLLSGMLFLIAGVLIDHQFLLIFSNLFSFAQNNDAVISVKEVMSMPSSVSAYAFALNRDAIQQATKYSHFFNLHAIANVILAINWFVIAWVFVALYKNQNRLSDGQIIAILLVAITNLGFWVGGYSLIFYITLLPVFFTMRFKNIYLIILVLLFAPLDFIPLAKETMGDQYSYLTNSIVDVHWTLGIGSVLRPILNFILMVALLYEIRAESDAVRGEGMCILIGVSEKTGAAQADSTE